MKKDYATALIELRSKLDISQTELAEMLGVSFQSVNRWENYRSFPVKIARVRIEKVCKEYCIKIVEALYGEK